MTIPWPRKSVFFSAARKAALALLCAACLCSSAPAQTPLLEKAVDTSSLTPLHFSKGGRILTLHAGSSSGFGSDDYESQWPGSYFEAAFRGNEVYFRVGPSHEILHVIVDGQAPLVLTDPQPAVYRLSGLEDKRHVVTVQVVTESQSAPNHFLGFGITAHETALTQPRRKRQIEFIGDSHTVGYGNTSPTQTCTQDEVWATTDDSQAFGAITGAHYQADYQVNAISGRGIVRNYNGSPGDTLPVAYPYILFDKKQTYSDPRWHPQVIVIALGTNDFSTPLNPGEKWKTRDDLHVDYEATYLRFLQSLRAKNPDAYFLLWATDKANGEIASEEQKVIAQSKAHGETKIAFIPVDHLAFSGCHSHPSLSDDKLIRDKLVQFIDAHPGIWQGK